MKSPLDDAILAARPLDMRGWRKIDEVPFDFERRRVSVLVDFGAERRLIVKGAPEDLLRLCGRYETATGGGAPLDVEMRRTLRARPSTRWGRRGSVRWALPAAWSTRVMRAP